MQTPLINHPQYWYHLLPQPDAHSHKYTRGAALILGGYPITGASRLAALACARSGAGITTLAVPAEAFAIYASACLSIMVKPYQALSDLQALLDEPRLHACLIGPGAGVSTQTAEIVWRMLALGKPVVIDADAITSLHGKLTQLSSRTRSDCVLTPHEGEFARLFGQSAGSDLQQRLHNAQQAATASQSKVILKGAQTVIASPEGRIAIHQHAPSTLATAGAGDVLAGILTGLLAQGMASFEACMAATWIQGEAAYRLGPGMIAEDLPGAMPAVLQALSAHGPER